RFLRVPSRKTPRPRLVMIARSPCARPPSITCEAGRPNLWHDWPARYSMSNFRAVRRAALLAALMGLAFSAAGGPRLRPPTWMFLGPAPIFDATTRFSGRIDAAVPDPRDGNVMYVAGSGGGGTTGGGIWKTSNWMSATPTWKPLIDHQPSLSIFAKSLAL